MRVLFDGFWWGEGPISNRQVQREFILAWIEQYPHDEVLVAVRRRHLETARAELPAGVQVVGASLAPHGVSVILELPVTARRVRADVMVTHNFTPAFGRSAVFVHDLMFVTSPEWFTPLERAYFALMPATIRRSRVVFTSSASEAGRIRRVAGARPVVPVGLDVGGSLRNAVPRRPDGLDGVEAFHLSVGRLNARKNLENAILGALGSGLLSPATPLVVVGEPDGRRSELASAAEAIDDGRIRFLGHVDDGELAWLYSNTRGLLFLSRDEGFGMPTLEAYEFGAPVLASDIPVFREILGDHAVYADPSDPVGIAAALHRLPPRTAHRRSAEELGYSWRRSVAAMRREIATTVLGHAEAAV
ncbi:glycosyltransferase family 4 protein [Agromyces sp. MMS24-JH15]|uniref:glycosyltransferase family 4 protein n=1 Tax=Agromyces sp. MMS24-JH15 TaxID=3243765 RepID=UPI0037499FFD